MPGSPPFEAVLTPAVDAPRIATLRFALVQVEGRQRLISAATAAALLAALERRVGLSLAFAGRVWLFARPLSDPAPTAGLAAFYAGRGDS